MYENYHSRIIYVLRYDPSNEVNEYPLDWILSEASTPSTAMVYSMSYGKSESDY